MFPNAQDSPAAPTQGPVYQPVARAVAIQLPPPKRAIALGHPAMLWATMPEATIHKNRQAGRAENEIGLAKQGLPPPPAGKAVSPEDLGQSQFGVPVAMRADTGHDLGTFGFGENISHFGRRSIMRSDVDGQKIKEWLVVGWTTGLIFTDNMATIA